jgi:hypothetical protein
MCVQMLYEMLVVGNELKCVYFYDLRCSQKEGIRSDGSNERSVPAHVPIRDHERIIPSRIHIRRHLQPILGMETPVQPSLKGPNGILKFFIFIPSDLLFGVSHRPDLLV